MVNQENDVLKRDRRDQLFDLEGTSPVLGRSNADGQFNTGLGAGTLLACGSEMCGFGTSTCCYALPPKAKPLRWKK